MGSNTSASVNENVTQTVGSKVRFYSKENYGGNVYEVDYGNYNFKNFGDKLIPDSAYSMMVPPDTTVKVFAGDGFDYGGLGSFHVTNVTQEPVMIPQFPDNIKGKVKSVSISKNTNNANAKSYVIDFTSGITHSDIYNLANVGNSTTIKTPSIETFDGEYTYEIQYSILFIIAILFILYFLKC